MVTSNTGLVSDTGRTSVGLRIPQGFKQTEAGVVPEDWDVVLLDSVAKRGSGHTPDKSHPEYWGGQIKWISLQDSDTLDRLYIFDTAAKITPAGIANSSARMHPEGTVVLSRDAGVGKSAIMKDNMAVSQHFMAWKCGPLLNNHFLYYWLQANKSEFERIAMGDTIKTIGLPYFMQLAIPLPGRIEQDAIAEALSDADALIESLEQLIAKKRQIKQGAMQELLTGKKRLPGFCAEWETKQLGDLLTRLANGAVYRPTNSFGLPITRIETISDGTIDYSRTGTAAASPELENYKLLPGDILFSHINSLDHIGKVAQFLGGRDLYHGMNLLLLRPDQNVDSRFLCFWLTSFPARQKARILAKQAVSQASINTTELKAVEIVLPSVSEQASIANILSDMDAEIATLEEKLAKARMIKQGMMQELLTGKTRLR